MKCEATETVSKKKKKKIAKCNQWEGVVKPDREKKNTAVPSGFMAVYTGATGEGVQVLWERTSNRCIKEIKEGFF